MAAAVSALGAAAGRSLLAAAPGVAGGPRPLEYCDTHTPTYDEPVDDVSELNWENAGD
jgi:hypothetical protein